MAKNVSLVLVFALLVVTLGTLATSKNVVPLKERLWPLAGLRLYRQISDANPGTNLIISPLSISMAIRMFHLGTNDSTEAQIEAALKLPGYPTGAWYYLYAPGDLGGYGVMKYLPLNARSSMLLANRLYGPFPFRESFLYIVREKNGVVPETLDFRADPDRARRAINTWVEWKTLWRVNNIFPPGSIANDSGLILVSALAFRAAWETAFEKNDTDLQVFRLVNGSNIMVPMMRRGPSEAQLYYKSRKRGFQVLKLLFRRKRESIYFVLPHRNQTLSAVEESLLETRRERQIFIHVRKTYLKMSIPKFQLGRALDLNEPLKQIGIVDVFDAAKAGFFRFSYSAGLVLTKVVHQSHLTIEERGTGFRIRPGPSDSSNSSVKTEKKVVDFVLNRPFLFLVLDEDTGTVILRGRVMNPLEVN